MTNQDSEAEISSLQIEKAGLAAKRLAFDEKLREITDALHNSEAARTELAEENLLLASELHRAGNLFDTMFGKAAAKPAADLRAVKEQITNLNGVIPGSKRSVLLNTLGVDRFVLSGQLIKGSTSPDSHIPAPSRRDAIFEFEFFDLSGDVIAAPAWTRQTDSGTDFRYIRADQLGWFYHLIELPQGTARLRIAAVDLRTKSEGRPSLEIGSVQISACDVMTQGFLSRLLHPEDYHLESAVGLRIGPDGTDFLVLLEKPSRSAHLLVDVEPPTSRNQLVDVTVSPRLPDSACEHIAADSLIDAEPPASRDQFVDVTILPRLPDSAREDIAAETANETKLRSCQTISRSSPHISICAVSELPFSQITVHLAAHQGRPDVLVGTSRPNAPFYYPAPKLAASVLGGTVSVDTLASMANQCKTTERWLGVEKDLSSFDAPLCFITSSIYMSEDASLMVNFAGADEDKADRRGLVLSIQHFDSDGNAISFEDVEFIRSEQLGFYQYVAVSGYWQDFIARLPMVEGSAYLAVILTPWRGQEFRFVSSRPTILPLSETLVHLSEKYLAPRKPVFSETDDTAVIACFEDRNSVLLPNSWRDDLRRKPKRILVRLSRNHELSVWRDLIAGPGSPDYRHFRKIVASALDAEIPVIVDVANLDAQSDFPLYVLDFASRVIVNDRQALELDVDENPELFEVTASVVGVK